MLEDLAERFGKNSLVLEGKLKLENLQVHQLLYVTDDINGLHYKISQLKLQQFAKLPEIPNRWYMIVGKEKPLTINELFTYNKQKHSFNWENAGVSVIELNEVVQLVQNRYEANTFEESERERKRIEQETVKKEKLREVNDENNQLAEDGIITNQGNIIYFKSVLAIMRKSTLMESSPGFVERLKDCEHDIQVFEDTGELSSRIHTYIRMMTNALNIG